MDRLSTVFPCQNRAQIQNEMVLKIYHSNVLAKHNNINEE